MTDETYQIELTDGQVDSIATALVHSATHIYETGESDSRDAMGEALELRAEIKRQKREQKYD